MISKLTTQNALPIVGILAACIAVAAVGPLQAQSQTPTARIVGGVPTSIDQVPATVALLRSARVNLDGDLFQAQFCGGTAITDRWILTAAHCVMDIFGNPLAAGDIVVLAGSEDLDNPVNQPIEVQQIIAHENYRSVEFGSDIALLHMATATTVEPIALDTAPINRNDRAFIAGWGAVNPIGEGRSQSFPKLLRGTFVDMTPGNQCASLFPEYRDYSNNTNICAGAAEGGRDSCQGDSGGPLYRVNSEGTNVIAIAGITSWGISCGVAETPGIYTNVSSYVDWIQGKLRNPTAQSSTPANDIPANDGFNQTQGQTPGQTQPLATDSDVNSSADASSSSSSSSDNNVLTASFSAVGLGLLLLVALLRQYARPLFTRHS